MITLRTASAALATAASLGLLPVTPAAAAPAGCAGAGTLLVRQPGVWELYAPAFACTAGVGSVHANGYLSGGRVRGELTDGPCPGAIEGSVQGSVWSGTATTSCGNGTFTIALTGATAEVVLALGA